jgi:hypothetical protein
MHFLGGRGPRDRARETRAQFSTLLSQLCETKSAKKQCSIFEIQKHIFCAKPEMSIRGLTEKE